MSVERQNSNILNCHACSWFSDFFFIPIYKAASGRCHSDRAMEKEYSLKSQLTTQEKANQKLEKELYSLQSKVQATESNLKNEKEQYFNVLEDVEKYRMFTGEIGVKGKGVKVSLEDASYIPSGQNVNNYIVHESHIFHVINELFISGASAVSINGQRITHQSYIHCNGPVVTVDGVQHPAPFVISAIGDPAVLIPALNIAGEWSIS